jgi:uncharacterized protein YceK
MFIVALLASGCGTMCNLGGAEQILIPGTREPKVYGGIGNDFRWVGEQIKWSVSPDGVGPFHLLAAGCFVIDVPFSFVGDTATIPCIVQQRSDAAKTEHASATRIAGAVPDHIE